jgi:hypothetical protein
MVFIVSFGALINQKKNSEQKLNSFMV